MAVDDSLGLVNSNEYLAMFIPFTKSAQVFRILSRQNPGMELINYGPLPLTTSMTLGTIDGGTAAVPAAGVMPARSRNTTSMQFSVPSDLTGSWDNTDMWYLPADQYRDRLFLVKSEFTPGFMRVNVEIPTGTRQQRFQKDRVQIGVGNSFGWGVGEYEMVHIPELKVGYDFVNPMNFPVNTNVRFTYGEYQVTIPQDPNIIFDILTKQRPCHWVSFPVFSSDGSVQTAFKKDYGIQGFPIFDRTQREDAVATYHDILGNVRPELFNTGAS